MLSTLYGHCLKKDWINWNKTEKQQKLHIIRGIITEPHNITSSDYLLDDYWNGSSLILIIQSVNWVGVSALSALT